MFLKGHIRNIVALVLSLLATACDFSSGYEKKPVVSYTFSIGEADNGEIIKQVTKAFENKGMTLTPFASHHKNFDDDHKIALDSLYHQTKDYQVDVYIHTGDSRRLDIGVYISSGIFEPPKKIITDISDVKSELLSLELFSTDKTSED